MHLKQQRQHAHLVEPAAGLPQCIASVQLMPTGPLPAARPAAPSRVPPRVQDPAAAAGGQAGPGHGIRAWPQACHGCAPAQLPGARCCCCLLVPLLSAEGPLLLPESGCCCRCQHSASAAFFRPLPTVAGISVIVSHRQVTILNFRVLLHSYSLRRRRLCDHHGCGPEPPPQVSALGLPAGSQPLQGARHPRHWPPHAGGSAGLPLCLP